MSSDDAPAVGYVLWYFPKLSETFVVEELLALGRRGIHPLIFARERPDEHVENDAAAPLLARTTWLQASSRGSQLRTVLGVVARHPVGALRSLWFAASTRSRLTFLNLWYGLILARAVERSGVRYLHAHFGGNATEMAWVASTCTGVPYGFTIHAVELYIGRRLCQKVRDAALVVTVCEYNVDRLRERCPEVRREDVVIKYAGMDADRFRLPAPRPARPARTIAAVGRLAPKKGFDVLIDAVAVLRGEGRDVRCVIAGDGGQRPVLQERIDRLGLGDTVELRGGATPEGVAALLAEADVLAAPCTIASWGDRDSMPVTIKEAMAMELPVVASDDFGIPEMISPECGVLVPRDDPAALAAGLGSVLDRTPEERAAMGRAGRAVVLARFDEDVCVEPLAARLQVLGRGRGRP